MLRCHVHALPYLADPTIYFSLIRHAPGAILLDSGRPASQRGRYDLMSAWPIKHLQPLDGESHALFADRLRSALGQLGSAELSANLPFAGGLMGYFSYDLARRIYKLEYPATDDLNLPHAQIGLYDWSLTSDHSERTSQLVFHPAVSQEDRHRIIKVFESAISQPLQIRGFKLTGKFTQNITYGHYEKSISKIHEYIQAGDCYQVNYTQRFQTEYSGEPWTAYQILRTRCATPFGGFVSLNSENAILSFSPERFVRCEQGLIETRPIKGTAPRGNTTSEDASNALALRNSLKDRAENLMIVDLLRNDLGKNCRYGSITVPELFTIESYPSVHHLVSTIQGEIAEGKDVIDVLMDAFPGGSITGAPKLRSMQIIDELEEFQRGIYCGSLLYIDTRGEMDSSIAIRTLLAKDDLLTCWGGGGIVADSEPGSEYQESVTKVRNLMDCLEQHFFMRD
ncbi:aminodeoxychorismate synthase component I [Pseudomonas sp. MDT1-16]